MPSRNTKEALKQLRQTRSGTIERARKLIKAHNQQLRYRGKEKTG